MRKTVEEIRLLEDRVRELEFTLDAIRQGKVDALITENNLGDSSISTIEKKDKPYQVLIESLSEPALTLTDDGLISHCNKCYAEMVKKTVADILMTSIIVYFPEAERGKMTKLLANARSDSLSKGDFTLTCYDASVKSVTISCVRLSYGRTQGFAITLKDISELSDIRERMNAANQRYRSLMEHVSCGICMLDVNGIILDLNQRMADIYGAVKKDVIGKYYLQYISPSDQAKSIERFKKINEFNDIYASEALITQPGGKVVEVEYSSICVNYENQKTIISVVNDVTERNKMRSQAILNGRLATIGTLSAGIIHEINNPLAWVNSNLNYLKRSLQNSLLPEDHRSKLAEVIDETLSGTDKMTEIIKDLKRFTRLDSAEGKTKISIVDALASAVKMAYPQFKNVATITTCYPEKIPDILAHFNKLHQVFLNLIVNAAQAFPEESEKNVISITAKAENNHIRIEFTDNGKGIAEDNLNKIFEPFFTTKPVGVGSGLGLSICRDIINQHGGEIDVVSELGKGTTFTVLLPVC